MFFPRYVCPSTTMPLYGAKSANAAGMSRSVATVTSVVWMSRNITGIMTRNDTRIMRTKPMRSDSTPPKNVMTAPSAKRHVRAKLPACSDVPSTWIQKSGMNALQTQKPVERARMASESLPNVKTCAR